jgi:hypothetical protein
LQQLPREAFNAWGITSDLPERDEPVHRRLDRNFAELIQEIRLVSTGAAAIFAFLMTLPFQARFADLDEPTKMLYAGALASTVLALLALTAPVTFHRLNFRRNLKHLVVRYTHTMVVIGLALLSLSIMSALWLALTVADAPGAVLVLGLVGTAVVLSWWVLPVALRVRAGATEVGAREQDVDTTQRRRAALRRSELSALGIAAPRE